MGMLCIFFLSETYLNISIFRRVKNGLRLVEQQALSWPALQDSEPNENSAAVHPSHRVQETGDLLGVHTASRDW
jgi:hypothetical protein